MALAASSSESDMVEHQQAHREPSPEHSHKVSGYEYAFTLREICFNYVGNLQLSLQPECDAVFCKTNCIMSLERRMHRARLAVKRGQGEERQLALQQQTEHQKLPVYQFMSWKNC